MNLRSPVIHWAAAFGVALAVIVGCEKGPSAPARAVGLNVTLAHLDSVGSSLLGASQNEILYHLDGPGDPPGHGVYGPFSTSASSGSVSFILKAPSNPGSHVLSLQLNDAATHQPLAVGAVQFNFVDGLSGGLVVDMGSVTRNCYFTNETNPVGFNTQKGASYNFSNDTLAYPIILGGLDIAFTFSSGPFYIEEAANGLGPVANSIAYLGNGDLVDFDRIPPASSFFPYSYQSKAAAGAPVTTVEAGDIYCIYLVTIPAVGGGHAWVQITDPGVVNVRGPNFRFRVNSTLPYFGYEQTPADLGNNCGASW